MPSKNFPLSPQPRIRLSRLRDIGWSVWDPIGLLRADQDWQDAERLPFANEYDTYLLQAAGRLGRGDAAADVARYLATIQVEYMGLDTPSQDALERAERVVAAILADAQLWTQAD